MGLREFADDLNGVATFATSAIVTGFLTFVVQYPRSCTGSLIDGTRSCDNFLGTTTMSGGDAAAWGTAGGILIGILALALREVILSLSSPSESD